MPWNQDNRLVPDNIFVQLWIHKVSSEWSQPLTTNCSTVTWGIKWKVNTNFIRWMNVKTKACIEIKTETHSNGVDWIHSRLLIPYVQSLQGLYTLTKTPYCGYRDPHYEFKDYKGILIPIRQCLLGEEKPSWVCFRMNLHRAKIIQLEPRVPWKTNIATTTFGLVGTEYLINH